MHIHARSKWYMCQWLSHVKVVRIVCHGSGTQAGRIPAGQAHRLAGYHCVKPTGLPDPTVSSPQAVESRLAMQTRWPDPNGPSAQVGPRIARIPAGQAHRLAGSQLAKHTTVPGRTCLPSAQLVPFVKLSDSEPAPEQLFLRPVCQAHNCSRV